MKNIFFENLNHLIIKDFWMVKIWPYFHKSIWIAILFYFHFLCLKDCDHNQMNQHDYIAKGLWPFFQSSWLLHIKEFLNEIFCNLLLKILIVSLIHHIFYVIFFQITMILLKV
jgi:hypothetical protein